MLLFSAEWLDDEVINAVQFLLKLKYITINGFQSTLLHKAQCMYHIRCSGGVKHKNMLLFSVEWLDNEVINAVQFLLKLKY